MVTMTLKGRIYQLLAILTLMVPAALCQNFEVTGQVGGQFNGGLDLHDSLFHRIDVQNGVNYGVTAGYLFGEHMGLEFQWNRNKSGTTGQPIGGGNSIKLFDLTSNQYMGNFLFHLADKETKMRPFAFFGLGANALSPDASGVRGATRFVFSLGGGAKYNMSEHWGLRGQFKWSPTYITTTDGGIWCDPFFGGCWVIGNDHYLHEFDVSGGVTFRF